MKKSLLLLLISLIIFLVPVLTSAEEDPESCICGRPYHTEDNGSRQKYDCVACGEKISNCTCVTCWCGKEITVSEDGTRLCSGCGNLCFYCTCADRDTMLRIENEKRIGRVSLGETPKPDSVWSSLLFLLCAGALGAVYTRHMYRSRRKTAVARAAEQEKLREERRRIMLKIEAEQNGGKT